jgi:hypothetical protein
MNAPGEFLDYRPDAILMSGLTGTNWRLSDYVARGARGTAQDLTERLRRRRYCQVKKLRARGWPDFQQPQMELYAPAIHRRKYRLQFDEGEPGTFRTAISCATTRMR